jgi:hypothetical protein
VTDSLTEATLWVATAPATDARKVAALTDELRRELLELGAEVGEPSGTDDLPEGAKAIEVAGLGALLVKFAPTALGTVVRTVQAWLRRSAARSAELRIDGDVITLTGVSSADQDRLIALLEAKYGRR